MTKNDFMDIARACGFRSNSFSKACTKHSSGAWVDVEDELLAFANAILERAAVEFDNRGKFKDGTWCTGSYDPESPGIILRSLKITK